MPDPNDMLRVDGTKKSDHGWLGPITNNVTGDTMTEVSIQFDDVLGGKPIPLLVPGLTDEEINQIQNMQIEGNARNFPQSAVRKAIAHAKDRDRKGLSPFYDNNQPQGGTMPEPKKMTELEESLEKAILAKNAQQIIDTLTKVRNEQQAYDDMVEKEMSYSKKMYGDSETKDENKSKARDEAMKNAERLPALMKKGEDALMDLKED